MRETVRSLRAYFILSGLAELYVQAVAVVSTLRSTISMAMVVMVLVAFVGIGFSIAFLYVGALLPALLRSAVDKIVTLLYVSAGWLVVSSVPGFFVGDRPWVVVGLTIGLLIVWYLLRNVRRLAGEAQNGTPAAQDSNLG
jgi:hypothetical protein